MNKETFKKLYELDCSDKIEVKSASNRKLSYLSWPWAWANFKSVYPNAEYEVIKFDGLPYICDPSIGIIVYTRVTVVENDIKLTHEMWLPVMDAANKAMRLEAYTYQAWNPQTKTRESRVVQAADMFDINKTIMRCLVKNLAMFGLGLSIYAGEDIPVPLSTEEATPEAQSEPENAAAVPERKPRTRRQVQTKPELPPENAAAVPERKCVDMSDQERLQKIIDWVMRQPDHNIAIQKISIGYDWAEGVLEYVIKQVKERDDFINDLNTQ